MVNYQMAKIIAYLMDDYRREGLAIEAGFSLPALRVNSHAGSTSKITNKVFRNSI